MLCNDNYKNRNYKQLQNLFTNEPKRTKMPLRKFLLVVELLRRKFPQLYNNLFYTLALITKEIALKMGNFRKKFSCTVNF
jgi:hypothetical protein